VLVGLPTVYGLAQETPLYYATTPVFVGGAPHSEGGLDLAEGTIDGCLWIALFAPKGSKDPDRVSAVRAALAPTIEGVHRRVTVGVAPALTLEDPLDAMSATSHVTEGAKVPVVWEITSGDEGGGMYITLDRDDGTAGMTQNGVVDLTLPRVIGAPTNDVRKNLSAGVRDRPPRIDDEDRAARLVAWLRLRIVGQSGRPLPKLVLSWVGFGAVEIDQRTTKFRRSFWARPASSPRRSSFKWPKKGATSRRGGASPTSRSRSATRPSTRCAPRRAPSCSATACAERSRRRARGSGSRGCARAAAIAATCRRCR
jgi:hypothetical protein